MYTERAHFSPPMSNVSRGRRLQRVSAGERVTSRFGKPRTDDESAARSIFAKRCQRSLERSFFQLRGRVRIVYVNTCARARGDTPHTDHPKTSFDSLRAKLHSPGSRCRLRHPTHDRPARSRAALRRERLRIPKCRALASHRPERQGRASRKWSTHPEAPHGPSRITARNDNESRASQHALASARPRAPTTK